MKSYLTKDRVVLILGIIVLLIYLVITRSHLKDTNLQLQLATQTMDSLTNKYNQTVYTQAVAITSSKKEMEVLKQQTDSIFALSKRQERRIANLLVYYKGVTTTRIDTVVVPFSDTIQQKEWSDSIRKECDTVISFYEENSIPVPITAKDSTANYTADITATKQGIRINSISIPDSQYIRFVNIKGGILKKGADGKKHLFTPRYVEAQVIHTNPLIKVTSQNSALFKPPKKNNLFLQVLIFAGGLLIGTQL